MCIVCHHIARLKVIVFDQVLSLLKPITLSMQVGPFAFSRIQSFLSGWSTAQTPQLERDVSCTPATASLTCISVFSPSILPKPINDCQSLR